MIEVRFMDKLWCPVVICDHCHTPIKLPARDGMVLWSPEEPQRPVLYLHKGPCDKQAQKPPDYLWEELGTHLRQLLYNTGLKVAHTEDD